MWKSLIWVALLICSASFAEAAGGLRYNQPPDFENNGFSTLGPSDVTGAIPRAASKGPMVTKSAPFPPPPALLAPSWTNFYIGLHAGAGWTNARLDVPTFASFSGVGMWGASGGVTAGLDYQFSPRFVAGLMAEGNVNGTDAKLSVSGVDEADFRESASWALRGRLGTLTSEETLVYVTAGVSETFTHLRFPNAQGLQGGGATYTGVVFGAGIETRLDGGLYGRFEYLHGLYGRNQFAGGLLSASTEGSLARIGLIFKPGEFSATGVSTVPPMRENWTGPYIGLQGGWAWESTRLSGGNRAGDGVGGSGPIGGGLIGYEHQFGPAVVALEVDGGGAGVQSSLSALNRNAQISYAWDYSIRARAGRLFGNTLAFASVGWSQTGGRLTTIGVGGLQASHVFNGVQFGGGLETMVTPHVGARLEYLQTFYDRYASVLGSSIDARPTAGKTRAAVIYKF